jgi:hypothetical protein
VSEDRLSSGQTQPSERLARTPGRTAATGTYTRDELAGTTDRKSKIVSQNPWSSGPRKSGERQAGQSPQGCLLARHSHIHPYREVRNDTSAPWSNRPRKSGERLARRSWAYCHHGINTSMYGRMPGDNRRRVVGLQQIFLCDEQLTNHLLTTRQNNEYENRHTTNQQFAFRP